MLAEGGWFCEIGKRDIYANSKIGMFALRKNITITAVDSDRLVVTHPGIVNEIASLVVDLIADGKLTTLPIEEYHNKKITLIKFDNEVPSTGLPYSTSPNAARKTLRKACP